MNVAQSIRVALGGLATNKLRTCLTTLGIVIGVAAVISLLSIGQGTQQQITGQIKRLGTNLLFVSPGSTQKEGVRSAQGSVATLSIEDAKVLPELVPAVVATAPEYNAQAQVLANGRNTRTRLTGTTPEYESVRNHSVASGEFLGRHHVDGRSTVAVLGSTVASTLFGDDDPVGATIRISSDGQPTLAAQSASRNLDASGSQQTATLRVIGVMETKGGGFVNQDDRVYIPITTMVARFGSQRSARGEASVNLINVQVAEEDLMKEAVDQISAVLRQRHRVADDDFTIQSQEDYLTLATTATQTFTVMLAMVASIGLTVGGIGIMNIMLVSVTERTREIGIRKAVGARRTDILRQFLAEAVLICAFGGILGVLVGSGLSRLIDGFSFPVAGGQSIQTVLSPGVALLGFSSSAAVGLFFGIYPASRAARLHPIEALRHE
jgi:putative ABC transport system permease protein